MKEVPHAANDNEAGLTEKLEVFSHDYGPAVRDAFAESTREGGWLRVMELILKVEAKTGKRLIEYSNTQLLSMFLTRGLQTGQLERREVLKTAEERKREELEYVEAEGFGFEMEPLKIESMVAEYRIAPTSTAR